MADLHATGRGARQITVAQKRNEQKQTRLHLKLSGEWGCIV